MKGVSLLVFVFLFVSLTVPGTTRADISSGVGTGTEMGSDAAKPYRRDENYVDVQPGDIDVWDNGTGISISGGGQTFTWNYIFDDYLVMVSKYLAADGDYAIQVDIWSYGYEIASIDTNYYRSIYYDDADVTTMADGSVYQEITVSSKRAYAGYADQGYYNCVVLRDGKFMDSSGAWVESPCCYLSVSRRGNYSSAKLEGFYASPFFSGKYVVYSSYECSGTERKHGFPVNLLPNAPLGAGSTNIPCKTTFRMLTGETTVYNTFYYTSSYMSGADEISASGTIRLDATKLVDGSVTRTRPNAPQLLCQKSTYGTVYDIVYTNDDNLLSLLGISKPREMYWDVAAQTWVYAVTPLPPVTPEPTKPPEGSSWFDHTLSVWANFPRWLEIEKGFQAAGEAIELATGIAWGSFVDGMVVASDAWYSLLDDYFRCFSYNETQQLFSTFMPDMPEGWKPLLESSVADSVRAGFTQHFDYDAANQKYVWRISLVAAGIPGLNAGLALMPSPSPSPAPSPGVTPPPSVTGDPTIGGGVADTVGGIASMVNEIVASFKQLLANIGEMGSVVKTLFGFLPPEAIGFIRVTVYGCLFIAFYKVLRG